jgi:DNA-binding LacI/PurR family transcriptional regulator
MLWCVTMTRRLAEVLDELGLKNGENIDIILFDCDTVGDLRGMSFTNVVQDGFRIGREAARMLVSFSREDRDEDEDQHRMEMRFPCVEQVVTCVNRHQN